MGRGGSRKITCPVTFEMLSSVPVMGESTDVLNHLINGLVSAMGSPFVTGSPSYTSR